MWIATSLSEVRTPTVIALGNFDGIHRGHQRVIEPILADAPPQHFNSQSANSHGSFRTDLPLDAPLSPSHPYITVVTFNPHPREYFSGKPLSLLTPLSEKAQYLESLGVEQLVLLPFNQELASLTPEEFVKLLLVQQLQVKRISVGQDFCFGRQRSGTTADLRTIAADYGISVDVVPLYRADEGNGGERISSSAIRQALQAGDLCKVKDLLGRPYQLVGQVVPGQQLGRTIGFPTANLQVPPRKFLPRQGVYSVWVSGVEAHPIPGVMNLGQRPTIDGTQQTIEVHLLDWTGDLYGRSMRVSLEQFLRPEEKFASLDQLTTQIQVDCAVARSQLLTSQVR